MPQEGILIAASSVFLAGGEATDLSIAARGGAKVMVRVA